MAREETAVVSTYCPVCRVRRLHTGAAVQQMLLRGWCQYKELCCGPAHTNLHRAALRRAAVDQGLTGLRYIKCPELSPRLALLVADAPSAPTGAHERKEGRHGHHRVS